MRDAKLREARQKVNDMRAKKGLAPSVQGNYTTDGKGNKVTVEERWRQLMGEGGKNVVRSDREVDSWLREVDSLEKRRGPERIQRLSDELQKQK